MIRPGDFNSDVWARARASMEERIASLRKQNDADTGERETALLRGRIAELKHWLSLSAPEPSRDEPAGIGP